MKKLLFTSITMLGFFVLVGCTTGPYDPHGNAKTGALIGAGTGAAAGALISSDKGKGAVIGGVLGAAAGGAAGHAKDGGHW